MGARKFAKAMIAALFALGMPPVVVASEESASSVILATGGHTCQIPHVVLYQGEIYPELVSVVDCLGGRVQLSHQTGILQARIRERQLTLWPWTPKMAVLNATRRLDLPRDPWLWRAGRLYVRPLLLERVTGQAVAFRAEPAALPIAVSKRYAHAVGRRRKTEPNGVRVLVDPGHGGEDLGAVAPNGTPEKVVTLAVGKMLAARLREAGYEVRLTRTRDTYPTLQERVVMANEWDADLMLSIHVNSAPRRSAEGVETYVLSREASDPRALALARFENAYEFDQAETGDALQGLLNEMARRARENETARLASIFHEHLVGQLPVYDRGVRKAPFFVLAGTTMPAFLLELGFISNPKEAKDLLDRAYQHRLARAVSKAVDKLERFLQMHHQPPTIEASPPEVLQKPAE